MAGVNLYAVALLLGVFGRLGLVETPEALTRTDVLIAAGALYLVEFVADKVPYLDSLWDVAHTVVRPLGAGAIGYLLAGQADSLPQALSATASGTLAVTSHAAKATTRAAVNTSPEPFSNIVLSLAEDGLVAAIVALAVAFPVIALVTVAVLTALAVLLTVKGYRALRTMRRRRAARRHGSPLAQRPGG
ncbi:MAG: DUF4126 domain-containing protein [Egibacteraceae bacterium]